MDNQLGVSAELDGLVRSSPLGLAYSNDDFFSFGGNDLYFDEYAAVCSGVLIAWMTFSAIRDLGRLRKTMFVSDNMLQRFRDPNANDNGSGEGRRTHTDQQMLEVPLCLPLMFGCCHGLLQATEFVDNVHPSRILRASFATWVRNMPTILSSHRAPLPTASLFDRACNLISKLHSHPSYFYYQTWSSTQHLVPPSRAARNSGPGSSACASHL